MPELARLDVTGSLGAEAIRLHGTLDVPDLNRALEGPGRHLLSDAFPRLKTLSLQGALGVEAEVFRQGTRWGMDGRVAPRNVSVAWQDVAEIGGLDGEIPVQIGDIPSAGAQGRLRWNSLSASFLHSGPGDVAVEAHPGTLGIPGPVTLEMAGGGVITSYSIHYTKLYEGSLDVMRFPSRRFFAPARSFLGDIPLSDLM